MPNAKKVEEILAKLGSKAADLVRAPKYIPELPKGHMPMLPEGAGPLAGRGNNIPLATPTARTGATITADTPEELDRLKKMMTGTPEEQAALVNEYAQRAGAAKERQLEEYFAKKQAGEQTGSITDKIFNPDGNSTSFVGKSINAIGYPQRKLMNALANAIGASGQTDTNSEKSAQAIVERAASALGVPETSTAGNVAKALGVAGLEVFGDPTSFLPIGKLAKAAGITHAVPKIAEESVKKAEAVKKALGLLHVPEQAAEGAKVVQSVLPAVQQDVQKMMNAMKAEEALKVFNHKPTEPTYAKKLLDKGARQIQPVGKIIKSR